MVAYERENARILLAMGMERKKSADMRPTGIANWKRRTVAGAKPSGKRSSRERRMSREVFAAPRGLQGPHPARYRDESCRG